MELFGALLLEHNLEVFAVEAEHELVALAPRGHLFLLVLLVNAFVVHEDADLARVVRPNELDGLRYSVNEELIDVGYLGRLDLAADLLDPEAGDVYLRDLSGLEHLYAITIEMAN